MPPAVDAALAAAARGLALFPLPPEGRVPVPGWQRQCTTDPDRMRAMVAAGNVGVGCRASDVVGLDLDRHPGLPDGVARFAALCDRYAAGPDSDGWPDTLTVVTPSGAGGQHLYFRANGLPIGSASGDRSPLGPGIDVRGPGRLSGGYLVGPGSTIAGRPYVIVRDTVIRDLPAWLADLLRPTGGAAHGSSDFVNGAGTWAGSRGRSARRGQRWSPVEGSSASGR